MGTRALPGRSRLAASRATPSENVCDREWFRPNNEGLENASACGPQSRRDWDRRGAEAARTDFRETKMTQTGLTFNER